MKARLLYRDADFDVTADLPGNSCDLIQDLELTTVLQTMAAGDKFPYDISARAMLACLTDPALSATASRSSPTASPSPRSSGRCTALP